jgi:hypothetical protein
MIWLRISDEMAKQLLLCCSRKPQLYEELLAELKRFCPEEPWQDQPAAIQFSRSRWSHEQDDIEIDEDAALSVAENGVWVQGWLWVSKEDLEDVVMGEVQDS